MAVSGAVALFSPEKRGEKGPTEREGNDPKDGLERSAEYWLREEEEEDDDDMRGGGGGGVANKVLAVTSIAVPFPFEFEFPFEFPFKFPFPFEFPFPDSRLLQGIWSKRIPLVDNLLLCVVIDESDVLFSRTVLYCFIRFKVAIIIFCAVL